MLTIIADHYRDGWGPGWGFPWFLFFWLVLLGAGLFALRRGWFRRPARHDARDVLAARYARGEIDSDEYRQRLDVLEETDR